MPSTELIKVMVSSRCNDPIKFEGKDQPLSEVRKKLQQEIEKVKVFGKNVFQCWINEDAPAAPGDVDSWEHCLNQVRDADIVIVLYNRNSGWPGTVEHGIGICHAEMREGFLSGAARVRVIKLPEAPNSKEKNQQFRNTNFEEYVNTQAKFWAEVKNGEETIREVKKALHDSLLHMVGLGVYEAQRGKYDRGKALVWSRMSYEQRKAEIELILGDTLGSQRPDPKKKSIRLINIANRTVLVCCHGIPATMSIAAAREMVGRPFLGDHKLARLLKEEINGPVHIIGCHKSVTENQAITMLGFPDATVLKTSFGVYVADDVQKIQLVFLADCRDKSSTQHAVQRFLTWLRSSGEAGYLVERAESRMRIIQAIAKEAEGGKKL